MFKEEKVQHKLDTIIVLIANCQSNGYGVLSSLVKGLKSIHIIACDPNRNCPSAKSRYVSRFICTPPINGNEKQFIDTIIDVAKQYENKIFLIPTNDTYLNAFHNNWEKLKEYFIPVFEVDSSIFIRCIEKKAMYDMAAAAGVPYPKCFYNSNEIYDDTVFPVILKPLIKTAENFNRIPFRIKKFTKRSELKIAELEFEANNVEYVIQQFISGEDESVHELYEEIFLLAQSMGSGEIEFCPDTNNALKRYTKASQLIEYGIVGIHEQDSQEQLIVQMMDLVAGITGWLREHYGTYRARKQSTDRHQQMDEFTRELHMRCEVVDHMLWQMSDHMWEVIVTDTGLWVVESERVVVVEY